MIANFDPRMRPQMTNDPGVAAPLPPVAGVGFGTLPGAPPVGMAPPHQMVNPAMRRPVAPGHNAGELGMPWTKRFMR
jgi:hypothetical protein